MEKNSGLRIKKKLVGMFMVGTAGVTMWLSEIRKYTWLI